MTNIWSKPRMTITSSLLIHRIAWYNKNNDEMIALWNTISAKPYEYLNTVENTLGFTMFNFDIVHQAFKCVVQRCQYV